MSYIKVFFVLPLTVHQLALYWGQDGSGNQKDLAFYCQSSSADIFPIAFLYEFFSTGDLPKVDFANVCRPYLFPSSSPGPNRGQNGNGC